MNLERRFLKDWQPEDKSTGELKEKNSELIRTADEQLKRIGPSLRDLAEQIASKKPDYVIFLDKSARAFGVPILKFLRHLKLEQNTNLRFYNDDGLKTAHSQKADMSRLIEQDFAALKGKQVFFVDDAFSEGRGANAIFAAADVAGIDASYFALTMSPYNEDYANGKLFPSYYSRLNEAIKTGKFKIYPNDINRLFSRDAYDLHIYEDFDEGYGRKSTIGRYSLLSPEDVDKEYDYIEDEYHPRHEETPKGASDWKEYDEKVRKMNLQTLKTIYQKVYVSMGALDK